LRTILWTVILCTLSIALLILMGIFIVPIRASILERLILVCIFLSTILGVFRIVVDYRKSRQRIKARIEQAEKVVKGQPDKAIPFWELASARLELYFEENLLQIKSTYIVSIIVMILGFAMIVYGVFYAFQENTLEPSKLSVFSGVIAEFISITFLIIYKSIANQAGDFVKTLERINVVGMAIQTIETISSENEQLKSKARIHLGLKILDNLIGNSKKV